MYIFVVKITVSSDLEGLTLQAHKINLAENDKSHYSEGVQEAGNYTLFTFSAHVHGMFEMPFNGFYPQFRYVTIQKAHGHPCPTQAFLALSRHLEPQVLFHLHCLDQV